MTFTDVGALVYYLKAIPWLVPGFSVTTHLEPLLQLQERLEAGDTGLSFPTRSYLIEAKRTDPRVMDAEQSHDTTV